MKKALTRAAILLTFMALVFHPVFAVQATPQAPQTQAA